MRSALVYFKQHTSGMVMPESVFLIARERGATAVIKIEAVVRPEKFEAVRDALQRIGVAGMSVIELRGCGRQQGFTERYRGSEYVVNLIAKVRVELVVADDRVEPCVQAISEAARTGEVGDGKIFLSPVSDVIRIRTGERGSEAL